MSKKTSGNHLSKSVNEAYRAWQERRGIVPLRGRSATMRAIIRGSVRASQMRAS